MPPKKDPSERPHLPSTTGNSSYTAANVEKSEVSGPPQNPTSGIGTEQPPRRQVFVQSGFNLGHVVGMFGGTNANAIAHQAAQPPPPPPETITKGAQRKRRQKMEADPEYRPAARRRLKKENTDDAANTAPQIPVLDMSNVRIAGMVQRLRDENAGQRFVPMSMELKHVLGIEDGDVIPQVIGQWNLRAAENVELVVDMQEPVCLAVRGNFAFGLLG